MELTEEILNRIKELEQLRDKEISLNPDKSKNIKLKYNTKIGCLKKYGVENVFQLKEIKEKIKQTSLEKYGVEHTSQAKEVKQKMSNIARNRSKEEKEKIKLTRENTMMKKYGVKYCMQSELIKDKSKKTCLEKYGKECITQTDYFKDKYKQTSLKHYGVEHHFKKDGASYKNIRSYESRLKAKQTMLKKYGTMCPANTINNNPKKISNTNKRFASYLNNNGIETEFEFVISGISYDLHILNSNILIEINPTISHSSTYSFANVIGKTKNNFPISKLEHFNRFKNALFNGYRLISIFETDLKDKILSLIQDNNISDYIISKKDNIIFVDNSKADFNKLKQLGYSLINIKESLNVKIRKFYRDKELIVYDCGISKWRIN